MKTRHAPRTAVLIFLITFAYAFFIKYLQVRYFAVNDFDTGIYSNVAWNIASGNGFYSDVLTKNHLGEHFSPIMLFFAPLYFIVESPLNIFFGMAVAYGASFALLYSLFRHVLEERAIPYAAAFSLMLLAVLFFAKPLNSALYYEFHPSTLALPFIAGALLALHKKRTMWLGVCIFFLLLTKENASLSLIGIGLYAWLVMREKKLGLVLCVLAGVYSLLVFKVIMPLFQTGEWGHYSRLGLFTDIPGKLTYVRRLLAVFAFLPLFAPRALACVIPLVALNLSVSLPSQYSLHYHYDDAACIFLAAAACHGLCALARLVKRHGRLLGAAAVVLLGISFISANKTDLKFKKLRELYERGDTPAITRLREEMRPFMEDKSFRILAQSDLGPYLSTRPGYRMIFGRRSLDDLPPEYIVLYSPVAGSFMMWPEFTRDMAADPRFIPMYASPSLLVYAQRNPEEQPGAIE